MEIIAVRFENGRAILVVGAKSNCAATWRQTGAPWRPTASDSAEDFCCGAAYTGP